MKKVFYFTNIASHYRKNLWEKLIQASSFEMHFFFGSNHKLNIKSIDFDKEPFKTSKERLTLIKNHWLVGKILYWQTSVIPICFKSDFQVAIFLGELSILSTWIASLICRFRGIHVIFWTHGLYGNEGFFKKKLRLLFYRLADEIMVYEKRAKKLLLQNSFLEDNVHIVYNSLDFDSHKVIKRRILNSDQINQVDFFKNNSLPLLIFVGRLTSVKKIDLSIKALEILNKNNFLVNLLLIGEGDKRGYLESLVSQSALQNQIYFYGACYDEYTLGRYISMADLCVSPGNVGLTAIHSLTFGTPVCTHNNWYNQMPEVEAIEEGYSGCFFEENNIASLAFTIEDWLKNVPKKERVANHCFRKIDETYNPYEQLKIIQRMITLIN